MYYGSRATGKPPGFTEEQHKAGLIPKAYYRTVGETPEGYSARLNQLGDVAGQQEFLKKMRNEWASERSGIPFDQWFQKRSSSWMLMPSK